MVTERFQMEVTAVGSDDGTHTYEIQRKWREKGKKSLVVELYPTLTASRCGSMDVSTMHLINHVQELGWGEVRIVNLYSKVFSEKPKVSELAEDSSNLSYIEEILEEPDIKEYDIIIAWGNTLTTHTQTIHAKADLLAMMKGKGLVKQVKCIVTDNLKTEGVHPLYLGLRHSKDVWKLKPYPLEKALQDLKGGEKKATKESEAVKKKKGRKRMYQRIKNKLDLEIVKESLKTEKVEDAVLKRIRELVEVLDREYGCCRGSSDMGGYVLLFTERETYECYISKLMECYHLEKNLSEYTERISGTEDGRAWQEELYLLSSDDALVLVYPAGQE